MPSSPTYDFDTHSTALILATISGVSTGLGGFVVLLFGTPSDRAVGRMLGFASGVMLFVSFVHLLPEAMEEVGGPWSVICFMLGMALFYVIIRLIPEPDPSRFYSGETEKEEEEASDNGEAKEGDVAGGEEEGEERVHQQGGQRRKKSGGDGGEDWRKESTDADDEREEKDGKDEEAKEVARSEKKAAAAASKQLLLTGLVVVTGIALHNVPEGMAVYLSTLKGWKLGAAIALAIGCHNIPEGMAVATTMYAATRSKYQSVKWAFLSGLAEPLGALAFGLFFHRVITEEAVFAMLAAVAGIMTMICLSELTPGSYRATKSILDTILSHVAGMVALYGCSLALDMM